MTELNFIMLENNKECIIVDQIIYNNQKYVFLVNSKDSNDFTIRKEINNLLVGLDNNIEFEKVMTVFIKERLKGSNI